MIYFVLDLEDRSWWGHAGKNYMLALISAGVECRFLPLTSKAIDPTMIDSEFHPITQRFGGGGGKIEGMIVHGSAEVVAKRAIDNPGSLHDRSVALVTWPTEGLSKSVLRGLGLYSEVWVPTDNALLQMTRDGLEFVSTVWAPVNAAEWCRVSPNRPQKRFVFYAIGSWGDHDRVGAVVKTYLENFKRDDPVLLHIVCPDAPFGDAVGLSQLAGGKEPSTLPRVSMDTSWGRALEKGPGEWRDLHKSCHCYVTASIRLDLDPWTLGAAAAGNLLCGSPSMFMSLEKDPVGQTALIAEERQETGLNLQELGQHMRIMLESSPPMDKLHSGRLLQPTGDRMLEILRSRPKPTVQVEEVQTGEQQEVKPSEGESKEPSHPKKKGRLAVVVSHKDRGREYLEAVWATLGPQLSNLDEFVVSDQGSGVEVLEEVERFVAGIGATLVTSEPPEGAEWSQAKCRNAGAKVAEELGAELVFFLDNDILLPKGTIDNLATVVEGSHPRAPSADIAIPVVADGQRFYFASDIPDHLLNLDMGTPRPGSGCILLRLDHFKEAGGYDESFVGWGSEDIVMLWRLEKMGHLKHVLEEVVLYHQPHDENPWKAKIGEKNAQRALEIMKKSEPELINVDGWGDGNITVLRGDKL